MVLVLVILFFSLNLVVALPSNPVHPLQDTLHLRYSRRGEKGFDGKRYNIAEDGEIFQDLKAQKLLHKWGPNFRVIVPAGDGSFIKYSGHEETHDGKVLATCEKVTLRSFQPWRVSMDLYYKKKVIAGLHSDDMKNYQNIRTTQLTDGTEREVWINNKVVGLLLAWTLRSDPLKKHVVPLRYETRHMPTPEDHCCFHYIVEDYTEVPINEGQQTDGWFRIPEWCPL